MIVKRAYPDTPVAMHYRPFDEIDWCSLLGADEVVLVITPVFLREVDEHKDHKRGALQQRARRTSSWLGGLRKNKNWQIRRGVRVEVNIREPELTVDFAAHGLQVSVNDDKIVACMIRDSLAHRGVPLVCVTADNALGYKVEGAGFEVVDPPEQMRIPDEPDQAERDKRELQKQVTELKKARAPEPDLVVRFHDGATHVTTIRLSGLEAPTEDELDEEVEFERTCLAMSHRLLPTGVIRPPSARAVDRYLEALRAWMTSTTDIALRHAHTFEVSLELANAGLGNASDVEIQLTFPTNIFVAETRKLPPVEQRPTPPPSEDFFASLLVAKVAPIPLSVYRAFDPFRAPSSERIEARGPHQVSVVVERAKHQSVIELPRFQAWVEVGQRPLGFTVDYRIHAASSANIKTGSIHVKLEIRPGPFTFRTSKLGRPAAEAVDAADAGEIDGEDHHG